MKIILNQDVPNLGEIGDVKDVAAGYARNFLLPRDLAVGALSLVRIRELLELVVTQRRAAGDANLHSLHGHRLFGADDVGDLPDGLHPNGAGYRRMGERFAEFAFSVAGPFA